MIITLPDTTTSKVTKTLVRIRDEAGAVALGRVLTLIIATTIGEEEDVIAAANDASREHPMRIIVVSTDSADADARLDAEIRVGGDAGASEVALELTLLGHQDGLVLLGHLELRVLAEVAVLARGGDGLGVFRDLF